MLRFKFPAPRQLAKLSLLMLMHFLLSSEYWRTLLSLTVGALLAMFN